MNTDLVSAAISAALASDWEKALKINLLIIKEDPSDLDTLNRLGRTNLELGEIKKAAAYFRKVLRLDKYNPIALKNLARIGQFDKRKNSPVAGGQSKSNYCDFIEEPGKTRIVSLVNISSPKTVSALSISTPLALCPKRHTIVACLPDGLKTYIGSLPDDLGHRLAILMKSGNSYETFIKSAGPTGVVIFIRELARGRKFKNIPSFATGLDRLQPVVDEEITLDPTKHPESTKHAVVDPDEEEETTGRTFKSLHEDEEPES